MFCCNTQKKTFFVSMIVKLKKNTLNGTISFMFSQQSSAVIKQSLKKGNESARDNTRKG